MTVFPFTSGVTARRGVVRSRAGVSVAVAERSSLRTFFMLLGGLAVLLGALLMAVNVYLVHGAFTLQQLQHTSQTLERAQQAAGDRVAEAEAPHRLAKLATGMGMHPAERPIFLPLQGGSARSAEFAGVRH